MTVILVIMFNMYYLDSSFSQQQGITCQILYTSVEAYKAKA